MKQAPPKKMTKEEQIDRAHRDYQAIVGSPHPMKNEYFDPATCEFEVCGFYEELLDRDDNNRVLGVRMIAAPTRLLGAPGMIEITLTETVTLQRGMKQVVVKASAKRPIRCWAMLQVLCGKKRQVK